MSRRRKLRERLARAKECQSRELKQLYLSYGFRRREGKKHVVYTHKRHKKLRAVVARQGSLNIGYVRTALRLLEELESLETEQAGNVGDDTGQEL